MRKIWSPKSTTPASASSVWQTRRTPPARVCFAASSFCLGRLRRRDQRLGPRPVGCRRNVLVLGAAHERQQRVEVAGGIAQRPEALERKTEEALAKEDDLLGLGQDAELGLDPRVEGRLAQDVVAERVEGRRSRSRRSRTGMSWSTRSAISTAAFSVKVRARISSGRARLLEIRWAMRRVRTVVLPVPAPAMMRSGPSPWSTASRWAWREAVEDALLGREGEGRHGVSLPRGGRPAQVREPAIRRASRRRSASACASVPSRTSPSRAGLYAAGAYTTTRALVVSRVMQVRAESEVGLPKAPARVGQDRPALDVDRALANALVALARRCPCAARPAARSSRRRRGRRGAGSEARRGSGRRPGC